MFNRPSMSRALQRFLNFARIGGAEDTWEQVRDALVLAGDIGDPGNFDYAVACLDHPDPRVVRAAVRTLWKTGGADRAEGALLKALPKAPLAKQMEYLKGMGVLRSVVAIPTIGALASRGPEGLRILALDTLGEIGDASVIPFLEAHLKPVGTLVRTMEPLPIRLAAVRALGSLPFPLARFILDRTIREAGSGPGRDALARAAKGTAFLDAVEGRGLVAGDPDADHEALTYSGRALEGWLDRWQTLRGQGIGPQGGRTLPPAQG
jgi:HEAT repeat protein